MEEHIEEPIANAPTATPSSLPPKKDLILPFSILAAALMLTGAIIFASLYKGGLTPANSNGVATTTVQTNPNLGTSNASATAILALGARDAILGNANASVTVIEYGDYQCPFCAQYFSKVEPTLIQNYVNTGKIKFVFRNFAFLGAESTAAAEAAECAEDQNMLWAYHDALYKAKIADDNKGGGEDDGTLNRTLFISIANQLHLNIPIFTSCIDTNKYANLVAQEQSDAEAIGVDSTPSTLVNGVIVTDTTGSSVGADPTSIFAAVSSAVAAH